MTWYVELKGDQADLSMLAASTCSSEPSICEQDGKFFLRSNTFAGLPDARSVSAKAGEILAAASGLTRLFLGGTSSVGVGGLFRERNDGGRDYVLIAETGTLQLRGMPVTLTVRCADGSQETHRPADTVAKHLVSALESPAMEKALRLRNESELGWVELYRLFEVIESEVPINKMIDNDWTSFAGIKLFKHTANSVAAAGDHARHGRERTTPPTTPMELPEARGMIDGLLRAWIQN